MGAAYEITAPVAGFMGQVAGVDFADGRGHTSVPGSVQYFLRHGYEVVPAAVGPPEGGEGSASGSGVEGRPARSARKADWVAYARQADPGTDGLDDLTKDELIDLYGGSDG